MNHRCIPIGPRAVMAARAIRETELFLEECLRHPHRIVRIPVVRVGFGTFPQGLAEEFWGRVLELDVI